MLRRGEQPLKGARPVCVLIEQVAFRLAPAGHEDAVVEGRSGLLVDSPAELAPALGAVVRDEVLRRRLGLGALEHSAKFSWEATARGTLAALAAEPHR